MKVPAADPPLDSCPEPIAIVGMGCRWPGGVRNTSQLWDMLKDKRDGFAEFKGDRINASGFYHPDGSRPGSMYTRGGFLLNEDTRNFDHAFFGMTAIETMALDPSQRKLLEVIYEAVESGGVPLERFVGSKTGVFVGNFNNEHQIMQYRDPDHTLPYVVTGGGPTILSNRINYVYNLKGPSLMVDTACSASMYALHLAVLAIRNDDCSGAIVAGANVILGPDNQIFTTKLGAVSPTSRCHTFDASADGYARAEGFGALYLKKLSDAVRDGNPIRAVVRGTAFNANGRTGGISHPSADGQEAVMRQAYRNAGNLNPDLTGYAECHGTGTPVGDPIEVSAVGRVFSPGRQAEPLLIGSIKPNLGHSEAASAMSQIMKSILAMEHGEIPATIGIDRFNSNIDFATAKCKVVTEMTPWPAHLLRRVSINSFGYGGANAHCILDHPSVVLPHYKPHILGRTSKAFETPCLQESALDGQNNGVINGRTNGNTNGHTNGISNGHSNGCTNGHAKDNRQSDTVPSMSWCTPIKPEQVDHAGVRERVLIPVSGHDESALKSIAARLRVSLDELELADLLYTLAHCRSRFSRRAFAVVDSKDVAANFDDALSFGKAPSSASTRIGFIFTGQGAQWPQMGAKLIHEYATFKQSIRYLDAVLGSLQHKPSWTIEQALLEPAATSQIHDPAFSQTVCTALQIALVALLRQWGVIPVATIGHSSGEIAAAYTAGHLKASEAVVLAYFRGKVVATNKKKGLMMAVGISREVVASFLQGLEAEIKIAAVNSPSSVTLSGEPQVIDLLSERFTKEGIFARILKTGDNAYHSHHMLALGPDYEREATEGLLDVQAWTKKEPMMPKVQWISSVSTHEETHSPSAKYWRRNLESPVLFSPAVETLAREVPLDLMIEVGPHPALGGPLKQIGKALSEVGIELPPCLGSLRRGEHDVISMLILAGSLFINNASVDLVSVNATEKESSAGLISLQHGHQCVDIFQYPYSYAEEPIYYENRFNKEYRARKHLRHDLLGARVPAGSHSHPQWRNVLRLKDLPWLDDHKLLPYAVLPGAAYITMAIEAATQLHQDVPEEQQAAEIKSFKLRQVAINSALRIEDTELGVETVMNMEKVALTNASVLSRWYKFSIGSILPNSTSWVENCTGLVCIETSDTTLDEERKLRLRADSRLLDMARWHQRFDAAGLRYGPTFQGLSNLKAHWSSNAAAADVDLRPTADMKYESQYSIHPATLDTLIQLAVISCHAGQVENLNKAFVPIFADNITIWNPQKSESDKGHAIASGSVLGLRSLYAQVQMFDRQSNAPLLEISELKCVTYDGASHSDGADIPRQPYWRPVSRVDSRSLTQDTTQRLFPPKLTSAAAFAALDKLAANVLASINEKLHNVHHDEIRGHSDFAEWVKAWAVSSDHEELRGSNGRHAAIEMLSLMLHNVPEAQSLKTLHDNIDAVFAGDTNSVKVLMGNDLLPQLFTSGVYMEQANSQLQHVVDLLAHKNPRMRVLEVGAGSASTTLALLETLAAESSLRRFDEYIVTDSAPWAVADAKTKLHKYNGVTCRTLDIIEDFDPQGFEEHSFDLIVAAGCLVEVADPNQAISQIHKLLKPAGSLALVETTQPPLAAEILSRTLSGMWRQEPISKKVAKWQDLLSGHGFSEITSLPDYAGTQGVSTVMLTQSQPETAAPMPKRPSDVYIVSFDGHTTLFADTIAACLIEAGRNPIHVDLLSGQDITPCASIISLVDLNGSSIARQNESYFQATKTIIAQAAELVWVASDLWASVECAIMKGLLRSVAAENIATKFSFIEIDHEYYTLPARAAQLIIGRLDEAYAASQSGASFEAESILRGGLLHIERMLSDQTLNEGYRRRHGLEVEPESCAASSQGAFMARYGQPGLLSSLCFCRDPDFDKQLDDDWVEIKTQAIGLNMKDLAVATAKFDLNKLSTEAAGTVTRVGARVSYLKAGDRVFGMIPGNMGNFVRSPASLVSKTPDDMTAASAASMPVVYLTAIYALTHLARITEGESVLVQSAAGGLGMATIQLAQHLGAEVYATVGNEEKRQMLIRDFGLQGNHIFNSRDISAVQHIMNATQQKGVDVIISSSGGDMMHETWRCIAPLGRFVDVGRTDVLGGGRLGLEVFKTNATFCSFDMGLIYRQKPELIQRLMLEMSEFINGAAISPIAKITTFDISQLESAMTYFSRGVHTGKIVITFDDPDATLKMLPPVQRASFDPDAAYLLVGCLGGLGRSLATWMVQQGANNLIFLSRTGADKPEATSILNDLAVAGAHPQALRCDITNQSAVKAAVTQISTKLSVKGVIHAAMVEGDSFFANSSLSKINKVLAPKVSGTINLHAATKGLPLDFFLMTSSIVGAVGTPSQGAYVAANAFQDAFARFRQSQSLPAIALALGLILEVGSVSDSISFQQMLQRNATYGVSETEFLRLLEGALCSSQPGSQISSHSHVDATSAAQIVTGLEATNFVPYLESGRAEELIWFGNSRFQAVAQAVHECARSRSSGGSPSGGASSLSVRLAEATSLEEKTGIVRQAICTRLAELLSISADDIDVSKAIAHYGVDSLVAGELRNWLMRSLGLDVSLLELLNQGTKISTLVKNGVDKAMVK